MSNLVGLEKRVKISGLKVTLEVLEENKGALLCAIYYKGFCKKIWFMQSELTYVLEAK